MIITIAVPAAHIADANQLAMVLWDGPAHDRTFGEAHWQDAAGNLYACASTGVDPAFIITAQAALARPAWDVDTIVNMTGAARAQALVVLWMAGSEAPAPLATTRTITAIVGMDGLASIDVMGLVAAEIGIIEPPDYDRRQI